MPIIFHRKRLLVFLVLSMMVFPPNISHGYDIKAVTSSQLKDIIKEKSNQVVAVIFLTTDNHFYQEHLPDLNSIYEKYRKKNVEFIGVLLDDAVNGGKDLKAVSFPVFKAKDKEEMSYINNIRNIPLVQYYKNGELKYKEDGYAEPEHVEEDLRNCVEGVEPHGKGTGPTSK